MSFDDTLRSRNPGFMEQNLVNYILGALSGQTMEQIEDAFAGKGYGDLKSAVADAVIGELSPIQAEYKRLIADKGQLEALMKEGREKAARVANRTMSKVYRKMGFIGLR